MNTEDIQAQQEAQNEAERFGGQVTKDAVRQGALRQVGGLALESAELVGMLAQVEVNGNSKLVLDSYVARARDILRRHI